ncbi:Polyisoprenoid-binding protein YceI [Mucilaginibacter sp. OK098]|nr:Polyisoprenoid-binding protein YceI [Mucilaginibacter sp. OK098]
MLAAAIIIQTAAFSQTWKADKLHSHITFTITHLTISDVDGSFTEFDATITATKPDFSDAKFDFNAYTNSVNTNNDYRDKDLKSEHFFEAEKYPAVVFTSTGIKSTSKNHYQVTGNMALHGVVKPVVFDLVYRGTVVNPKNKKTTSGFIATGVIKRSYFAFASGYPSAVLSDEVTFKASGEFTKAD